MSPQHPLDPHCLPSLPPSTHLYLIFKGFGDGIIYWRNHYSYLIPKIIHIIIPIFWLATMFFFNSTQFTQVRNSCNPVIGFTFHAYSAMPPRAYILQCSLSGDKQLYNKKTLISNHVTQNFVLRWCEKSLIDCLLFFAYCGTMLLFY